jgi:tRNA 2-thiouridine synthesizing protein A
VDARGRLCPLPVLRAEAALAGLEPGQVVEILADDEDALLDVPAWCARQGHEYLGEVAEAGFHRLRIRRR